MSELFNSCRLVELERLAPINSGKTTFLARKKDSGVILVLKQIMPEQVSVYRFLKEKSPKGVPRVYDIIEMGGGVCYIAEEYISGETLEKVLDSTDLSEKRIKEIIYSICEILIPIHKAGIVHRDINPSNILISTDGYVKLIDFGIAREVKPSASKDTTVMGTEGYTAPEQYGFEQTKPTADVYSIGAVWEEMLRHCSDEYEGGSYFEKYISRCMELDPKNRFGNAEELLYATKRGALDGTITLKRIMSAFPLMRSENSVKNGIAAAGYIAFYLLIFFLFFDNIQDGKELMRKIAGVISMFIVPFLTIVNWKKILDTNPILSLFGRYARTVILVLFVFFCLLMGEGFLFFY